MRSIEFQNFIDLVTFDQSLIQKEQDIKNLHEQKKIFLLDIERLQAEFVDFKTAHLQARKAVDEKELYMKVLDEKEAQLKKKLQVVSNQKEYKSLEKETLSINAQRIAHEHDLLALWNKLENFEKSYEGKHKLYDGQVAQLMAAIEIIDAKMIVAQDELQNLIVERVAKEQGIPQDWLHMYVNMKGRVSNPVIQVINNACDACFYSVTPRDLQLLKNNTLLQCRDCYRLLYVH